MRTTIVLASFLLAWSLISGAQTHPKQSTKSTVPVYVSHAGQDARGSQFVEAVKRTLSKSSDYKLGYPNSSAYERGFRLYVKISTLDVSSPGQAENSSAASVVVEEMGRPSSWPVPFMWYHKVFLVKGDRLDELAQQFISDMDAHWCNTIKNSVGNCPKESIPPIYP